MLPRLRVEEFALIAGSPSAFQSSDHATRSFCPRCGTPLTFRSTRFPGEIDVTTCSLDQPDRVPPREHIYTSSEVAWMGGANELPRFPAARE